MNGAASPKVVAARDAARDFSGLLERLPNGGAKRYLIFFRNRPQAVLLHLSEYERLIEQAGEAPAPSASAALA
jgi:PHD/YefM family antitoxin component YafN of YafNO toxin-antitoxin module